MAGPYSGVLYSHRKSDLIEICDAMKVQYLPGAAKIDLEDAIKDALRDSKSLRESKQFKGLWESMNEEEPTTNQSPKRLSAPNSTTTSTGRTPRRSIISKVPSTGNLKSTIQEKVDDAKNSLPDARSLIPSSVANGVEQLGELVPHVDTDALAEKVDLNRVKRLGRKSIGNLKKVAKESVEVVQEGTVKVQEVASEKWTVVTSLIAVELGYLGWSAVPWATKTFGEQKWLLRQPSNSFQIPYPDLTVLYHPTFTHPFLKWTVLTILLPLTISIIFAFPQGQSTGGQTASSSSSTAVARRGSRNGRNQTNSVSIAPPNVLSFSIARLALVVLVGVIFRNPVNSLRWSFDNVVGFPGVGIVGAAAAVAFSAGQF